MIARWCNDGQVSSFILHRSHLFCGEDRHLLAEMHRVAVDWTKMKGFLCKPRQQNKKVANDKTTTTTTTTTNNSNNNSHNHNHNYNHTNMNKNDCKTKSTHTQNKKNNTPPCWGETTVASACSPWAFDMQQMNRQRQRYMFFFVLSFC